jgi:hypothetical protein
MTKDHITKIIEAETASLQSLDGSEDIETTYTCPLCGGTAHLVLHEWLGYESHCENGCYTT